MIVPGYHKLTNTLILRRRMKWRQNTSTSCNGSRNPSDSKYQKISENILEMHLFVSFHNLSILSLCVEEPVMTDEGPHAIGACGATHPHFHPQYQSE